MRDKAYYQGLLLNMAEPLKPHYSKDCAHLELGGGRGWIRQPDRRNGGILTGFVGAGFVLGRRRHG